MKFDIIVMQMNSFQKYETFTVTLSFRPLVLLMEKYISNDLNAYASFKLVVQIHRHHNRSGGSIGPFYVHFIGNKFP